MPVNVVTEMLGDFLASGVAGGGDGLPHERAGLGNADKALLGGTALAAYVVGGSVLGLLGLPAVPGFSTLLFADAWYAWPVATAVLVLLTLAARLPVGRVRPEAAVFCATFGLLALAVRGGDARNALLDAGSAGVYVRMASEQIALAVSLLAAYLTLARRPATPPGRAERPSVESADRLWAVGMQAVVTLALLSFLALSPVKGQTLLSAALAGGAAAAITLRSQRVHGSVWYVAGTMLCGLIAYAWTALHPAGYRIGDVGGLLAGPARVLPLHYATAGVAGTLYGYWIARTGPGEADDA